MRSAAGQATPQARVLRQQTNSTVVVMHGFPEDSRIYDRSRLCHFLMRRRIPSRPTDRISRRSPHCLRVPSNASCS